MSDSINRSTAIHAVCSFAVLRYKASQEDLEAIGAVLNALPPSQPGRTRGEWITLMRSDTIEGYLCSECGTYSRFKHNFCKNCGAQLRR